MKQTEIIIKMAKDNNGIVTNVMIDQAGISRGNLKHLTAVKLYVVGNVIW